MLSVANEAAIRDELAQRLELIEPGLTLVETNFPLRNAHGTRGFIDVLARDATAMLVVIEIKRSDSTAREAIHEVLKYVELLRRERGVASDKLRAIIVSTTWRELLVPFSVASRVSPVPLSGFQLGVDLNADPLIGSVDAVVPLDAEPDRSLSGVAVQIQVASLGAAEGKWLEVMPTLRAGGVDDALALILEHPTASPVLHVGLGRVIPGDERAVVLVGAPIKPLAQGLVIEDDDDDDEDDDDDDISVSDDFGLDIDTTAEQRVASAVVNAEANARLVTTHKFARMIRGNSWTVTKVMRAGTYSLQADLTDDEHLIDELAGDCGLGQVMYTGAARPVHEGAWRAFRRAVRNVLFGNPQWTLLMDAWLGEAEAERPDWDVHLHLYNPCDVLAAFVFSDVGDLSEMTPQISGGTNSPKLHAADDDVRLVEGVLMWDGQPRDVERAFRAVFEDDGHWWMARVAGALWEMDIDLLRELGLHYELVEFRPGDFPPDLLTVEGATLVRTGADSSGSWPGCEPFPAFLEVHAKALYALANRLRSATSGPDAFGNVLAIYGPDGPILPPDLM